MGLHLAILTYRLSDNVRVNHWSAPERAAKTKGKTKMATKFPTGASWAHRVNARNLERRIAALEGNSFAASEHVDDAIEAIDKVVVKGAFDPLSAAEKSALATLLAGDGDRLVVIANELIDLAGRVAQASGGRGGMQASASRENVLAASLREFNVAPDDYQRDHNGRARLIHINGDLREAGLSRLTENECAKLSL